MSGINKQSGAQTPEWRKNLLTLASLSPKERFESKDKKLTIVHEGEKYSCLIQYPVSLLIDVSLDGEVIHVMWGMNGQIVSSTEQGKIAEAEEAFNAALASHEAELLQKQDPETLAKKWRARLLSYLDLEQEPRRGFDSKDKKLTLIKDDDKYICIPKNESHRIISFYINKDGTLTSYYYSKKEEPDTILKSNAPHDLREKAFIFDQILAKYESEIRDFFTKKLKKISSDTEQKVMGQINDPQNPNETPDDNNDLNGWSVDI